MAEFSDRGMGDGLGAAAATVQHFVIDPLGNPIGDGESAGATDRRIIEGLAKRRPHLPAGVAELIDRELGSGAEARRRRNHVRLELTEPIDTILSHSLQIFGELTAMAVVRPWEKEGAYTARLPGWMEPYLLAMDGRLADVPPEQSREWQEIMHALRSDPSSTLEAIYLNRQSELREETEALLATKAAILPDVERLLASEMGP